MPVAGPGTSSHSVFAKHTVVGPTVTSVTMHTPAMPAVSEWFEETTMLRLFGAMTVISFIAVWVPTVSVIVTVAGPSGAVHAKRFPEAPAAGVPPVAVQVPATEPVKSMTSPMPPSYERWQRRRARPCGSQT